MNAKGLTLVELVTGVLLAAVLAAISTLEYCEANHRAKMARTYSELQRLGAAMESYQVDFNGYPPSEAHSPLGSTAGSFRQDSRLLSTPVAYLAHPPFDPMAPENSPLIVYSTHRMAPQPPDYNIYPHNSYLAWSVGPDGVNNTDGYLDRETVEANEALAVPVAGQGRRYDPTNGVIGFGDVYFFGPRSE